MSDFVSSLFQLPNLLRQKLGVTSKSAPDGAIDPKKIAEADALLKGICGDALESIGKNLDRLVAAWDEMKKLPDGHERQELSDQIFTYSHEIKDIGMLCGYELISHFAESLRDYISKTALNLKNQQVIIQAHVDAMSVAHKKGLRENGGPAAEELKRIVKVAIDKYN